MTSTSQLRSIWHTRAPAYGTAPLATSQALHNYRNVDELRYQASDIGSAGATRGRSSPLNTSRLGSSDSNGGGNSGGDLWTQATIAIRTIIPLVFTISVLPILKTEETEKSSYDLAAKSHSGREGRWVHSVGSWRSGKRTVTVRTQRDRQSQVLLPLAPSLTKRQSEMDATEAERQKAVGSSHDLGTVMTAENGNDAAEVDGIARVSGKPIPVVENDSTPGTAVISDVYIPYRSALRGGDARPRVIPFMITFNLLEVIKSLRYTM